MKRPVDLESLLVSGRSIVLNGAGVRLGAPSTIALMEGTHSGLQNVVSGPAAASAWAPLLRAMMEQAGWMQGQVASPAPERVVVVTGPGSFTGLRASMALAAGLGAGWMCPVWPVPLADAVRCDVALQGYGRAVDQGVDVLCHARRGRVFVVPAVGKAYALALKDQSIEGTPTKGGKLAGFVAGDAVAGPTALPELLTALRVRAALQGGKGPMALPCQTPSPKAILLAGAFLAASAGSFAPLEPFYVDAPEAKLPAAGLRPQPHA
ncbi:tRNA threonylcarbamoyladenosine biosynthesis protein TsaB [Formicincola oecophyllae]|nr:tRNA (adenosine(37)-N6)-threonylcarbamoyltransferase complex dimerization subunit type 1 TsaB [Formicincola oecophyllae]